MDACVPLESSSYTLDRVLGCFEIDTGVAMTFFFFSGLDFDSRHFDFSSRDSFRQNLTGRSLETRACPASMNDSHYSSINASERDLLVAAPKPPETPTDLKGGSHLMQSHYGRPVRAAGVLASALTLCQNTLGSGALAMPLAFGGAGLSGGILALLLCLFIAAGTLMVLAYINTQLKATSIEEMIIAIHGKRFAYMCQVLVLLTQLGAAVLYLQIIRDSLGLEMHQFASGDKWYSDQRLLIAAWVLVISPLCFFRRISSLAPWSVVGVISVCYTVVFVMADSIVFLRTNALPSGVTFGFGKPLNVVRAMPVFLFGLASHIGFIPISAELAAPTTVKRLSAVAMLTVVSCASLYMIIGVFGYLRFGPSAPGSILNAYFARDIPAIIARLAISFLLSLSFPLLAFISRLTWSNLVFKTSVLSTAWHISFTAVWVCLALAICIVVQDIGVVFVFLGSTAGVIFIVVIPMFMWMATFRTWKVTLFGSLCILLGVAIGSVGIARNFIKT